jgi:hypothetical protein
MAQRSSSSLLLAAGLGAALLIAPAAGSAQTRGPDGASNPSPATPTAPATPGVAPMTNTGPGSAARTPGRLAHPEPARTEALRAPLPALAARPAGPVARRQAPAGAAPAAARAADPPFDRLEEQAKRSAPPIELQERRRVPRSPRTGAISSIFTPSWDTPSASSRLSDASPVTSAVGSGSILSASAATAAQYSRCKPRPPGRPSAHLHRLRGHSEQPCRHRALLSAAIHSAMQINGPQKPEAGHLRWRSALNGALGRGCGLPSWPSSCARSSGGRSSAADRALR